MARKRSKLDFDLREIAVNEDERRVTGYAAVFDSIAEIGGYFREKVLRGAFKKTLQERDQVALWQHDSSKPLASTRNKTLTLSEDEHGLRFEFTPPKTSWGNDAYEAIKSGLVRGVSFGFEIIREKWNESTEGPLRELQEVSLFEISPVTFPAYDMTEVEARAQMPDNFTIKITHGQEAAQHSQDGAAGAGEPRADTGAAQRRKAFLRKQRLAQERKKWTNKKHV